MQERTRTLIATPPTPPGRPDVRAHRPPEGVQLLWRRHGWIPPTEVGKDFRASLKNTVDRQALSC